MIAQRAIFLVSLFAIGSLTGCSSNFKDFQEIFSIGKDAKLKRYKLPPVTEKVYLFPETKASRAMIATCRPSEASAGKDWPAVLMVLPDTIPFTSGKFCADPLVQAFLGHGYSVARSAYVAPKSTPKNPETQGTLDSWGQTTVDRNLAAIKWLASAQQMKVVGVMGYGAATIAALQTAQQSEGLRFTIAGNGIYDLEKAFAQGIGPEVEALKSSPLRAEDDEYLEQRSIAWDYTELPKDIALYHGQLNQHIAPEHAESFRDSLEAAEFRVHFELIKDQGHALEPVVHQRYLDSLLKSWPAKPAKK